MNMMMERMNTRALEAMHPEAIARQAGLTILDGDELLAFIDRNTAEHPDFHDGWGAIRERRVPFTFAEPRRRSSVVITELDAARLEKLLERDRQESEQEHLEALRAELEKAEIVCPRTVPKNVVTMNSWVLCEDQETRVRAKLRLAYPGDARRGRSALSVLSPVGTALLGISVGEPLELPAGHELAARLRVRALPYQPEREGHFHV
jgi:regulator of nucleoside diphosphate kinase